jgi:2-oxoglutarate dehydrogenase E1 component
MSGLVMLLPHGYEGQGPEHSSARLERFLQACGDGNMGVYNITTPANFFHMLRRQIAWPFRKPAVVMSPKSLLRHPACVSDIAETGPGTAFQPVIAPTHTPAKAKKIKRLLFCTGKIYYDLAEAIDKDKVTDVAIVRLEQLYPFPEAELAEVIAPYRNLKDVIWCQEEPMNQGAWYSSQHHMRRVILQHSESLYLGYAGREPFAAPAGGHPGLHTQRQQRLVEEALLG